MDNLKNTRTFRFLQKLFLVNSCFISNPYSRPFDDKESLINLPMATIFCFRHGRQSKKTV